MSDQEQYKSPDVPLYVSLDGALIKSDIDFELFFALLARSFTFLFLAPIWLLKGKANFKQQIALRTDLDPALLPYNQKFLRYLREQKKSGRTIILITAANKIYAQKIANHLDLFDEVLASDEQSILYDDRKAASIQSKQGTHEFDYVGNAQTDKNTWRYARKIVLANPTPAIKTVASPDFELERIFDDRIPAVTAVFRAMRPHQWLKNILLFVTLLASHRIDSPQLVAQAILGFIVFCFCTSSVYLLNDLIDLQSDRTHQRKRFRPLAAGQLSIQLGTILIPVLLLVAITLASFLPSSFLSILAGYYLLTLLYSLWLKRVVLLDVLILAILYTFRIVAGGAAVEITPSFWLLTFSMFIFFSLAMIKRYTELVTLNSTSKHSTAGRDYDVMDADFLMSIGTSSGLVAVLVLALYINSNDVIQMYSHPQVIWLLCPVIFYWIGRVWLLAKRGKMHDDPLIFAIKDPASWWAGAIAVGILFLAT